MEAGGGRQRRSAVRYTNVAQASASPILSKANKTVEFHLPEVAIATSSVPNGIVVASVGSMQGWRKDNEDRHVLAAFRDDGGFPIRGGGDSCERQSVAIGVFDGHRGQDTAAFCAQHIGAAVIPVFQHVGANASGVASAVSDEVSSRIVESFQSIDDELKVFLAEKEAAAAATAALLTATNVNDAAACSPNLSPQLSPRGPGSPAALSPMLATPRGSPSTGATGSSISGSTAVVAICREKEVIVLNVGDSRAYVITQQKPSAAEIAAEQELWTQHAAKLTAEGGVDADSKVILPAGMRITALSDDHRTSNEHESARITAAGGFIVNSRVNGKLSVTRAFGDFDLKGFSKLDERTATSKPLVVCTPDICRVDSMPLMLAAPGEAFSATLVGCDGVWELQSAEKIAVRLHNKLQTLLSEVATPGGGTTDAPAPSLSLLEVYQNAVKQTIVEALHAGCAPFGDPTGRTPGSDNMSLGIVLVTAPCTSTT